MYLGYEVGRYGNLRNHCDESPMYRWAASRASDHCNTAHIEFFASPYAPGLFSLEGACEAVDSVATARADGFGSLDIYPFLGKEQVAQGAVAVGATLC
jgi:hypothetical protein